MNTVLRTGHTPRARALVIALSNHQQPAHDTMAATCLLVVSPATRAGDLGSLMLHREFGHTELENQAGRTT